jgi:hypothetical protein
VIFSDEKGSRFDNGLLGSQAMSGELNTTVAGISLHDGAIKY